MAERRAQVIPLPRPSSSPSEYSAQSIPTRGWNEVIRRVDRLWQPEIAPHHSILGQNGSGKSYMIVNGLLPLCHYDRVCIFDSKGDDPVLASSGAKPVRQLPNKWRRVATDRNKPNDAWYRLMLYDDRERAQDQAHKALEDIYSEGDWIVVLDETRALSDPRSPGLGLQPQLDRMWLRGRSRHISVIAATQAPRWVPSSFYDQPQFVWASRIRDEKAHIRMREIGSMSKDLIPQIAATRKRRWIYMDDEEDETWLAETGL